MRRRIADAIPVLAGLTIGATIITALAQLHRTGC